MMVGYGMARFSLRVLARSGPSAVMGVAGIGLYLWLGMAMSGPITLLRRRSRPTGSVEPGDGPLGHLPIHGPSSPGC